MFASAGVCALVWIWTEFEYFGALSSVGVFCMHRSFYGGFGGFCSVSGWLRFFTG